MLNSKLVHEAAHFLARTRCGAVTMGKLTVAVYGESARGNKSLREKVGTLGMMLENKGYVGIYKRARLNQQYYATDKGLGMIKDYPGWDELCKTMDELVKEDC